LSALRQVAGTLPRPGSTTSTAPASISSETHLCAEAFDTFNSFAIAFVVNCLSAGSLCQNWAAAAPVPPPIDKDNGTVMQ
jgi:hypothetical protein